MSSPASGARPTGGIDVRSRSTGRDARGYVGPGGVGLVELPSTVDPRADAETSVRYDTPRELSYTYEIAHAREHTSLEQTTCDCALPVRRRLWEQAQSPRVTAHKRLSTCGRARVRSLYHRDVSPVSSRMSPFGHLWSRLSLDT